MHYLLLYDFAPDYLERRSAFRAEHLRMAWEAQARGEVILAGAFAEPADGGMLLFSCDSPSTPEQFAACDPYVKNGLVTRWRVRVWNTVVGELAVTPTRL